MYVTFRLGAGASVVFDRALAQGFPQTSYLMQECLMPVWLGSWTLSQRNSKEDGAHGGFA